ncbi:MAG: hypothetical protein FIB06_06705 [Betaproteobacteria bacterium]|nr:hypothetical protein [Betaproteobacteria bacterium]
MAWRMAGCIALLAGNVFADISTPLVAGLDPSRRPPEAPVIRAFEPPPGWQARALRGIAEPRNGTAFLKDQGAWYTPFDRPGSTGVYDIRGFYGEGGRRD